MNQLATPADATPLRGGFAFSSIGVEVDEALFLDETDDYRRVPRAAEGPSPFELFADENAQVQPAEHEPTPGRPPELFKHYSGTGTSGSVSLIALIVLVAATMTLVLMRGCAVSRNASSSLHAQAGQ